MFKKELVAIGIFSVLLPTSVFGAISQNIIPSSRVTDWTPGVTVGVPGGIPTNRTNLIDVTQAPYNADNTGASDATAAIRSAIAAAQTNDVVYLPAGTYKVSAISIYGNSRKSNITLRGSGMDETIIKCSNGSTCLQIGSGSDWNWPRPSTNNLVTAGKQKGSTSLTLEDATPFSVGQLIRIQAGNDKSIPIISVSGYDWMRKQMTQIIGKNGNTITISPGLYSDFSNVDVRVKYAQQRVDGVGVEDLTIDGREGNSFQYGIWFEQTVGSWVKNVRVVGSKNYSLFFQDSLLCEVRHSYLDELNHAGSNGAGLLMNTTSGCLIEDNIMVEAFPVIEVNHGSSGNVFGYNFINNADGLIGIDTNHGPQPEYNLYEGNIAHNLMSDGYFGGSSNDTIFRNWMTGLAYPGRKTWCISLKRLTRNYSMVGNILGTTGQHTSECDSYGQPNIGNGGSSGTAQLSAGDSWQDWDPVLGTTNIRGTLTTRTDNYHGVITLSSGVVTRSSNIFPPSIGWMTVSAVNGNEVSIDTSPWQVALPQVTGTEIEIWPGPGGFQELDLDVEATTLKKVNYSPASGGIRSGEALSGGEILPNSLYYSSKPLWFGSFAWPPFNPNSPNESYDAIPASYRYFHLDSELPSVNDEEEVEEEPEEEPVEEPEEEENNPENSNNNNNGNNNSNNNESGNNNNNNSNNNESSNNGNENSNNANNENRNNTRSIGSSGSSRSRGAGVVVGNTVAPPLPPVSQVIRYNPPASSILTPRTPQYTPPLRVASVPKVYPPDLEPSGEEVVIPEIEKISFGQYVKELVTETIDRVVRGAEKIVEDIKGITA